LGLIEWGEIRGNEQNILFLLEARLFFMGVIGIIFSKQKQDYRFFLAMSLSWAFLAILMVAFSFGISQFIESKRVLEWIFLLNIILIAGVFELIYRRWGSHFKKKDGEVYALYTVGIYFILMYRMIFQNRKTQF
jgi:NADH:ubiquinone oxidoreductase subunit K